MFQLFTYILFLSEILGKETDFINVACLVNILEPGNLKPLFSKILPTFSLEMTGDGGILLK